MLASNKGPIGLIAEDTKAGHASMGLDVPSVSNPLLNHESSSMARWQ